MDRPTKDCENLHPLLSLHLEDKLSARERARVARHLGECADARAQLEEYRILRRMLLETPEPVPPPDFHGRILDYVYEKPASTLPGSGSLRPWWNRPAAWGLAAAALSLALFFNLFSSWREVLYQTRSAPAPVAAPSLSAASSPSNAASAAPAENAQPFKSEAPRVAKKAQLAKPLNRTAVRARFAPSPASPDSSQPSSMNLASPGGLRNVSYGSSGSAASPSPLTLRSDGPQAKTSFSEAASTAADSAALPSSEMPVETGLRRWGGSQGPYPGEHAELVEDPVAWSAYWQILSSGEPLPNVDFKNESVALIFLGTRPTAGYNVLVDDVVEGPDAVTVLWHEQAPAPDASSSQVLTRPWAMQVIPRTGKPVVFQKRP